MVISFGPFSLVPDERLLSRDGVAVPLGARTLDTLMALVSVPNEVVSKRDLMARVWPDVIVEEGSLRFHIAELRKALGDGKGGARYITTLAGRGYCFVAPITRSSQLPIEPAPRPASFPRVNLPNRLPRMVDGKMAFGRFRRNCLLHVSSPSRVRAASARPPSQWPSRMTYWRLSLKP